MDVKKVFTDAMNFKKPEGRLPAVEWAPMWNLTVDRWRADGLPTELEGDAIKEYLGLDSITRIRLSAAGRSFTRRGQLSCLKSYEEVKGQLYSKSIISESSQFFSSLNSKNTIPYVAIDGFFWFPRVLYGIENHFYAFYDHPEVIHAINRDLSDFITYIAEELTKTITPVFFVLNEDMAYNHGPMLSKELFDEFLLPYYKKVVPVIKSKNMIPFVDSDGFMEDMIPWIMEGGIEGILPLERQSDVDVARIRSRHPSLRMLGAFNKLVMDKGEEAMRSEFERLLPVMRQGGFVPSVDHQTPPAVSLENYKIYVRLLKEYCLKAVDQM